MHIVGQNTRTGTATMDHQWHFEKLGRRGHALIGSAENVHAGLRVNVAPVSHGSETGPIRMFSVYTFQA